MYTGHINFSAEVTTMLEMIVSFLDALLKLFKTYRNVNIFLIYSYLPTLIPIFLLGEFIRNIFIKILGDFNDN